MEVELVRPSHHQGEGPKAAGTSRRPFCLSTEDHRRAPVQRSEKAPKGDGDMFAQQERERVDWSAAVCRDGTGNLVELFFSEQLDDIARAKAICGSCALAEPCLEGALERREPWGVWGGQLLLNGVILPFKRKRGRPPKHLAVAALPA